MAHDQRTRPSDRMRFDWNSHRRVLLLSLSSLLLCGLCFWFQMFRKTSFLDDAFIYLHIANNVLETGTARFFPIAESPVLLASSPLRLLILVPAALASR